MTARLPADPGEGRVRVPADLDRPDPILAGLSARQLAILAAAGLAAWTLVRLAEPLVGFPMAAGLAAPVALIGVGLALGWREGRSLDRLVLAGLGWWAQPRRRVVTPGGLPPTPAWTGPAGPRLGALTGPISGLDASGVLELAGAGRSLLAVASPVNLRLRSPAEQQQLLAGFARLLHARNNPLQVLVRSQPADLASLARRLRGQAAALAHPALEQAALAHADWLQKLAGQHQARHRELLVIFHHPACGADAAAGLARQAEQATALLAAAGVTLTILDGDAAGRVLAAATCPASPTRPVGLAPAGTVITGAQP